MPVGTHHRQTLVGRASEIRVLEQMVAAASSPGGTLVLKGDTGIGKSALLSRTADYAAALGCEVLWAQGVQSEALLPFAALQQLLDPVISNAERLVPVQRDALLTALGYANGRVPERYQVALAALNLLVLAASRRPLVVVADDVHWFDEASQEALAFLARRAGRDPFTVLAGLRTGHGDPFAHTDVAVLEVQALDRGAARELLDRTAVGMSPRERAEVAEVAAGNPLALLELPVTWSDAGLNTGRATRYGLPGQLELAFSERMFGLSPGSRDVLLVSACASTDDTSEILRAAGLLHGGPLGATALGDAVEAGLLVWDDHLRFRHPLVRSAVLRAEPVSRQMATHQAIADSLPAEPYRRALHRAQAIVGRDDDVADELERNVQVALGRGGIAAAMRNLELAAQLTSSPARRGHRLLLAAQYAFALGRADLVDRLVVAASATDLAPLDVARMEWLREIFDEVPGDAARVRELCAAARLAADEADPDLALDLLLSAALRCWWSDTGADARQLVVTTTKRQLDEGNDPRYIAALAVADPVGQGRAVMRLLDRYAADDDADGPTLRLLGMAAHAVGDEPRAAFLLDRAEAMLRNEGRLGLLPQVLSMEVMVRLELGDLARAERAANEARILAADTRQPIWDTGTIACAARAHALRGHDEDAIRLAREAELVAQRRGLNDVLAVVQLAKGTARLAVGNYDEAFHELARLFDPADAAFHARDRFGGIGLFVDAAVATDRRADADRILSELDRDASVTPSPILVAHRAYADAVLDDDCRTLPGVLDDWPWLRARLGFILAARMGEAEDVDGSALVRGAAEATMREMGAEVWISR